MQGYALTKGAVRCYQAVGTTDISTASTSYVDMTDMSITFTLKQKKDVMVFFQAPIQKRDGQADIKLVVDGADRNATGLYHHDGSNGNEYTRFPTSLNWKENLAAGQHTVKIQWKITGGNAAYSGTNTTLPNAGGARILQVLELGAEQENPIVVPGSINGWVVFDNSGTILDSFNVSGIVKNGTGDYTISWDKDFSSSNYCVVATGTWTTTASPSIIQATILSAGQVQVTSQDYASSPRDCTKTSVMAIGN